MAFTGGPSGSLSSAAPRRHEKLVVVTSGTELVRFENGDSPRVVFTAEHIQIGCHKVSLEAWELLNERYQRFLEKGRREVIQEGNY